MSPPGDPMGTLKAPPGAAQAPLLGTPQMRMMPCSSPAYASHEGLVVIVRRVIHCILNPSFLSYAASYGVASNIRQALPAAARWATSSRSSSPRGTAAAPLGWTGRGR